MQGLWLRGGRVHEKPEWRDSHGEAADFLRSFSAEKADALGSVFNGPRGCGEDVLYLNGAVSVVKNEVVAVASAIRRRGAGTENVQEQNAGLALGGLFDAWHFLRIFGAVFVQGDHRFGGLALQEAGRHDAGFAIPVKEAVAGGPDEDRLCGPVPAGDGS